MNENVLTEKMTTQERSPVIFDEFFELGQDETVSPMLTPDSRKWAKNLSLRLSILSTLFLALSFFLFLYFPSWTPISSLLLLFVYVLSGFPYLIHAIEDILSLEINIDVLMTLAAFSSVLIGSEMEGALLLVLFALSGAIEEAVTNKAKGSLLHLHRLTPSTASVILSDDTIGERSIKDISPGTKILVKAGETVPLDGVVIEGSSSINLVHLTGENLPISKTVNDEVPAGARNLDGALILKVTRTSSDSTVAKIINLVTQAQEAKPKLQTFFDKVSEKYALSIIFLSFAFALLLPYIEGIPFLGPQGSIYRSLAFLIAASPCALILAIPIAYLSAISICAKQGILLKGGITLDAIAKCSILAFDKTGTITLGKLRCVSIEKIDDKNQTSFDEAISVAAALEKNAVHPIARAIVAYAKEKKIKPAKLTHFKHVAGYGLEGVVSLPQGSVKTYIGRPSYIKNFLPKERQSVLLDNLKKAQSKGMVISVILIGDNLYTLFFEDTIRPHMKETIEELNKNPKVEKILMLTGDHEESAKRVAKKVGIRSFKAGLLPEDKLKIVDNLSLKKGLAMIGDGINDAPALARATAGICMGKVGSQTAAEAADTILLHDDLHLLNWLINKSHQTKAIVKQNLVIASLAILFATTPALLGLVPLWLAVVLHEGGTVLVGLNALRLLKK